MILTVLSSKPNVTSSSASVATDSMTLEDPSSSISTGRPTDPTSLYGLPGTGSLTHALAKTTAMTTPAIPVQSSDSGLSDSPSTSSQELSTGGGVDVIVGGVIGTFGLILFAAAIFCVIHRRRRRQKKSSSIADSLTHSFTVQNGLDILIPHSSRSSFEKDPYPHTSFRPSEAAVDDRPISLDKKGSWNKQDSLPPSIYGYGVGLNSPSAKKKEFMM